MADKSARSTRSGDRKAKENATAALAVAKMERKRSTDKRELAQLMIVDKCDRKKAIGILGYKIRNVLPPISPSTGTSRSTRSFPSGPSSLLTDLDTFSSSSSATPSPESEDDDGETSDEEPPNDTENQTLVLPTIQTSELVNSADALIRKERILSCYSGRILVDDSLDCILGSLGLQESFDSRVSKMQVDQKTKQHVLANKWTWHKNFEEQSKTPPPYPTFLTGFSAVATLPGDQLKLKLRSTPADQIVGEKVKHRRKPDALLARITPVEIPYGWKNSVFWMEFSKTEMKKGHDVLLSPKLEQLIDGMADHLAEQSGRSFVVGFGLFGTEGVFARLDSETLRLSRWPSWTKEGIWKTTALYRTLLCASPYQLGLCPLFLDDSMGTSTTTFDPSILDDSLSSFTYTLDPHSIAYVSREPFHRRPHINRAQAPSSFSPSIVVKFSQQGRYQQEAHALRAVQPLLLPSDSYSSLQTLILSLSFERSAFQANESEIEYLTMSRKVAEREIVLRHLEVIVTSTSSRGELFQVAETKAQDLFKMVESLLKTVMKIWPQVCHQDISTQNVLKLQAGGFCLIDLDCSKLKDGEDSAGKGVKPARTGTQDTMSIQMLGPGSGVKKQPYTALQDFESVFYVFLKYLTKKLNSAIKSEAFYGPGSDRGIRTWLSDFRLQDWTSNSGEEFWSSHQDTTLFIEGLLRYLLRDDEEKSESLLELMRITPNRLSPSECTGLLSSIDKAQKALLADWDEIYLVLGWDIFRLDFTVAAARQQLWSRRSGQIGGRIIHILNSLGGDDSKAVVDYLIAMCAWGKMVILGGGTAEDDWLQDNSEEAITESYETLMRLVKDVEAGSFLENVWKHEW